MDPGHGTQYEEQGHRRGEVQEQVGDVVSAGFHAVELDIQHIG